MLSPFVQGAQSTTRTRATGQSIISSSFKRFVYQPKSLQLSVNSKYSIRPYVRANASASASASSADEVERVGEADDQVLDDRSKHPFPFPLPKDFQQKFLGGIPLIATYPLFGAVISVFAGIGFLAGRQLVEDPTLSLGISCALAAVFGGAALFLCLRARSRRASAAVIDLYNSLVEMADPAHLRPEHIHALERQYGINFLRDEIDGLKRIYGQFIQGVIPHGDEQLSGSEADKIRAFKDTLGLSDEDAAPVHVEIGRRFHRDRTEAAGDRAASFSSRRSFQRLIYISQLVFGERKAAFLLPWGRYFGLTEAQILVAKRDNARIVLRKYLESLGGESVVVDRKLLGEIREQQLAVRALDETAEELVKAFLRRHIEKRLGGAAELVRNSNKSRDLAAVVEIVQEVLDYTRRLASLAAAEDAPPLPGLAAPTLAGGVMDTDEGRRDCKDIYRVFLEERMAMEGEGGFSDQLEKELHEFATLAGIAAKDCASIHDEVAAKVYKQLLKEEVLSGRLDEADSPASILETLCVKAHLSPESAMELHKGFFRQKLQSLLRDRVALSEEDEKAVRRMRRVLCLPTEAVHKALRETIGRRLEEALRELFAEGAKPIESYRLDHLDFLVTSLRIEQELSLDVLKVAARGQFRKYIADAQKADKARLFLSHVRELLKFNGLVVTPVLDTLKGSKEKEQEIKDLLDKAMRGSDSKDKVAADGSGGSSSNHSDSISKTEIKSESGEEGGVSSGKDAVDPIINAEFVEEKKSVVEVEGVDSNSTSSTSSSGSGKEEEKETENITVNNKNDDVKEAQSLISAALDASQSSSSPEPQAEAEAAPQPAKASSPSAASSTGEEEKDSDAVSKMQKLLDAAREPESREDRAQTLIGLRDDMELKKRQDLYKQFLVCNIQKDAEYEKEKREAERKNAAPPPEPENQSPEEMQRLGHQFAELLGLSQFEVLKCHNELAERGFRKQAIDAIKKAAEEAGGAPPSDELIVELQEAGKQMGLRQETIDAMLNEARTEVYGSAGAAEEGKWTLERIVELKEKEKEKREENKFNAAAATTTTTTTPAAAEVTRRNIFRRELTKAVTDGKGAAQKAYFWKTLPAMLDLPEAKVRKMVKEELGTRRRMLLVQAVSLFRQRRALEAVTSLNNLISCVAIMPLEAKDGEERKKKEGGGKEEKKTATATSAPSSPLGSLEWREKAEMKDLFTLYALSKEGGGDLLYGSSERKTAEAVDGEPGALAAAAARNRVEALRVLMGLTLEDAKEILSNPNAAQHLRQKAGEEEDFF